MDVHARWDLGHCHLIVTIWMDRMDMVEVAIFRMIKRQLNLISGVRLEQFYEFKIGTSYPLAFDILSVGNHINSHLTASFSDLLYRNAMKISKRTSQFWLTLTA